MTDTIIVDDAGSFVVGKAQTTPEDESKGFMSSAEDALEQWGSSADETFPLVASGIFSGTAMLNRLLSRQGLAIGDTELKTLRDLSEALKAHAAGDVVKLRLKRSTGELVLEATLAAR